MIKHSEYDFKYRYLRTDTEWQFMWASDTDTEGTIRFYPFRRIGSGSSWYFCGEAKPNGESAIDHNPLYWQDYNPIFEYNADDISGWDSTHPLNMTRYLRPSASIVKLTNSVKFVHIDTVPPEFISDLNTDYVVIKNSTEPCIRNCSFEFTDSVGLDYRQIEIRLGQQPDPLYKYDRKTDSLEIDERLTDLKIFGTGNGKYKVTFKLAFGATKEEVAQMNSEKIILTVYDLAANYTTYYFGNDGSDEDKGKQEWKVILTDETYERLIIKYYDIKPENMIVDVNTEGSTWVEIYNPNKDLWVLPITYQLAEQSIGKIDESTFDDTYYSTTGTIRFKVDGITECGFVVTQAWLETGTGDATDKTLISATFAEDALGFWRVIDPEGRLYNFDNYVPTFLKSSDAHWYDFIKFTELFFNSCYTDMKKKKCISVLEKIARIIDFNEVDRMEEELLPYYSKEYGCEFDVDLEMLKGLFK